MFLNCGVGENFLSFFLFFFFLIYIIVVVFAIN